MQRHLEKQNINLIYAVAGVTFC